jgi:hypothetical protein
VIAYKEMRAIEVEINRRRGELERRSDIPLTNSRGIELRQGTLPVSGVQARPGRRTFYSGLLPDKAALSCLRP